MATIPSLALIPSGYKASKVYSVLPTDGTGDFDFTRSGNATRVNSEGLIELVSSNVPRLNYPLIDGVVQGCPSLLLEPLRINLFTYSEDFSNAAWTKASVSITSNAAISPDGTLNASLMTIFGGTSDQRIFANISYSGTNVVSVFAKASDSKWFSIRIGNNVNKWYDLENGVLGDSTLTGGYVDADIQDYGNGWYRCILVFTDNFNTSTRFYPAEGNLDITHTSGSVYIWGAQSETSSSYPTSYIPTSGSTATRSAETCNNAGDVNTFNDSEGVLFAEISALANEGGVRAISLNDGSTQNRISIRYNSTSNQIQYQYTLGSVVQASITYNVTDVTANHKIAIRWAVNDFELFIDGVSRGTDVSGNVMSSGTLTTLDINGSSVYDYMYAKIKGVQVLSYQSDAEMIALTSL